MGRCRQPACISLSICSICQLVVVVTSPSAMGVTLWDRNNTPVARSIAYRVSARTSGRPVASCRTTRSSNADRGCPATSIVVLATCVTVTRFHSRACCISNEASVFTGPVSALRNAARACSLIGTSGPVLHSPK
jgi:hypothetical protein